MAAMLGGHNNVTIKAGLFKSYKWTHFGFLGKSVGETQPWGRPLEKSVYC